MTWFWMAFACWTIFFVWNSCKCFIVAFWIQKLFADNISDWCSAHTWFSDDDSTKLYSRNYISNFAWLYAFWLVSRADLMSESGLNGPQFRVWATLILNHWKQFKVHGEHGHPTKKRISWSWLDLLALYQVQQGRVQKLDFSKRRAILLTPDDRGDIFWWCYCFSIWLVNIVLCFCSIDAGMGNNMARKYYIFLRV